MKIINASDFEQKSKVQGLIAKLRQLATVNSAAYVSSKRFGKVLSLGALFRP